VKSNNFLYYMLHREETGPCERNYFTHLESTSRPMPTSMYASLPERLIKHGIYLLIFTGVSPKTGIITQANSYILLFCVASY
jgi:hypothetical protein